MFLLKSSPYGNTTIRFIEEFNIWNIVTEFYKGGLDVIIKCYLPLWNKEFYRKPDKKEAKKYTTH